VNFVIQFCKILFLAIFFHHKGHKAHKEKQSNFVFFLCGLCAFVVQFGCGSAALRPLWLRKLFVS